MLKRTSRLGPRLGRQRGVSLVEMMIGTTVGLFIVVGSIALYVNNLTQSRRLLLETAVNQQLRAAADLIARDLRRAGYWGNAIAGTSASGTSSTTTANPYRAVQRSDSQITYLFANDTASDTATQQNTASGNEQFGFRLDAEGKTVEMQTSNGVWVPITRPQVVQVTAFTITPQQTVINLGDHCSPVKAPGAPRYPTLTVRSYTLELVGVSAADTAVRRRLDSTVRVRNDAIEGDCAP